MKKEAKLGVVSKSGKIAWKKRTPWWRRWRKLPIHQVILIFAWTAASLILAAVVIIGVIVWGITQERPIVVIVLTVVLLCTPLLYGMLERQMLSYLREQHQAKKW